MFLNKLIVVLIVVLISIQYIDFLIVHQKFIIRDIPHYIFIVYTWIHCFQTLWSFYFVRKACTVLGNEFSILIDVHVNIYNAIYRDV